jgi:ATP-binding cassette subfamily F protein 3
MCRAIIIGANGRGKLNLFKPMPHITQEATENYRADRDYVSDSDNRLRTIERAIEDAQFNDNHLALSQACADFETADGHTGNSRSEQLLHGLGFKQTDMARSIADFSKGWRILLNLAHGKYLPTSISLGMKKIVYCIYKVPR